MIRGSESGSKNYSGKGSSINWCGVGRTLGEGQQAMVYEDSCVKKNDKRTLTRNFRKHKGGKKIIL